MPTIDDYWYRLLREHLEKQGYRVVRDERLGWRFHVYPYASKFGIDEGQRVTIDTQSFNAFTKIEDIERIIEKTMDAHGWRSPNREPRHLHKLPGNRGRA